jgi:glutamate dehydrogenase/leucine dehydrogenase
MSLKGATVALQGFGNVAYYAATNFHDHGAKLVAVSDSSGGIYNPDGLDPRKVMEHKKEAGRVLKYPGSEEMGSAEVLTVDCDLAIPAALENVIDDELAEKIKADMIVEAANGPTLPSGDKVINDKGIILVPDICANAGGVTVSYFEWVQNRQGYYWTEEEVDQRLERIMVTAFKDLTTEAEKFGVDLRTGAYALAIGRVAEAMRYRGII